MIILIGFCFGAGNPGKCLTWNKSICPSLIKRIFSNIWHLRDSPGSMKIMIGVRIAIFQFNKLLPFNLILLYTLFNNSTIWLEELDGINWMWGPKHFNKVKSFQSRSISLVSGFQCLGNDSENLYVDNLLFIQICW